MAIRRIGVLTSGGDAPGMNAAVRATVRTALSRDIEVIGIKEGYRGLAMNTQPIQGEFELNGPTIPGAYLYRMSAGSVGDIIQRGGTILRSARLPEFATEQDVRDRAYATLKKNEIDALVVLGGDGTFRGAECFRTEAGISVAGVPCTIDNDMSYSDVAIGFDTAVNTAVHSINNLRDTMSSHDRVAVVEVMGRACGDLAVYAGLAAGAEAILVPELNRTEDEWMAHILKKLAFSQSRGKRFGIIVMAEGLRRDNKVSYAQMASLLESAMASLDKGGYSAAQKAEMQAALIESSKGEFTPESIALELKKRIGADARGMTLAHVQRGGSPTASDRILASRLAAHAVDELIDGATDCTVGIRDGIVIHMPITQALAVPRRVNRELIALGDRLAM